VGGADDVDGMASTPPYTNFQSQKNKKNGFEQAKLRYERANRKKAGTLANAEYKRKQALNEAECPESRGYIPESGDSGVERELDSPKSLESNESCLKECQDSREYTKIFDEPRIAIFSQSRPLAKDFLRQIMREFENNDLLKELFPDILYLDPKKESPKWSEDDGIVFKREGNPRESSVEAWGLVDGQPTGKHFNILIYDDVVTIKSVTTGDMIRKTTEAVEMSYNLGTDGGVRRFVGTIYDDQDTYQVLRERKTANPRIYPATDDGTAMGKPVFMSDEFLAQKIRDMGPFTFATQMLLDPVPKEDAFFSRDDFLIEQEAPNLNLYICSDFAVQTALDGGKDWTEHGVFGVDAFGNPWVIDWWSGQTASDVWIDAGLDLARDHPAFYWVGESGQIRRSVEPFLNQRMAERASNGSSRYIAMEWLPPIGNKPSRMQSFHGLVKQRGLRLLSAPWNLDLINELVRFPKSQKDHKADACSLFGRALGQTWAVAIPNEVKSPEVIRDYQRFHRPENTSWKVV
jgi:predicted phage terminase large subunit-like protein